MASVKVLVVENNANWSHWSSALRERWSTILMLIQQPDESKTAFHERIEERLARLKSRALEEVVLLRGDASVGALREAREPLFEQLGARARRGLRVHTCGVTA